MKTNMCRLGLAIDPGKDTGWSLYVDGRLFDCGLGEKSLHEWLGRKMVPERAVIEKPRVYPGTPAGQANDLITLAINVGQHKESCERYGTKVELVEPATWKGSLKKEVHHVRILKSLSPGELRIVQDASKGLPKSKVHNMLDGVALGKWAFGS